jgi:hypothetical protein
MLFKEIITVYSEKHTERNMFGQKKNIFNIKSGCYSVTKVHSRTEPCVSKERAIHLKSALDLSRWYMKRWYLAFWGGGGRPDSSPPPHTKCWGSEGEELTDISSIERTG